MASTGIGSAYRHLRDLFGGGSTLGLADAQLLARYASSKDGAAFEALVGRHGPMVLATCRAILRNEQDAEDAFQATFLVLARKAGSVQEGEALGGWLHRVARRSAVQASLQARRRRRKEAEASAMTPPGAAPDHPVDDLRPILHEEIDRLPESQRLPVILCDLQGLTYDQAAQQLDWTEPSLRCRLARGRKKLRDRLTRRGITAPAVALLLAGSSSTASVVPALLVRSVVAAATGGTASAGVLALTQIIMRRMLMTKIQIASTALMAAIGLTTAGVIATGAGRPEDPEPSPRRVARAAAPKSSRDDPPGEPKIGQASPIRGRVVGPDGKPVSGAVVQLAYIPAEVKARPESVSGPDGRFSIPVPDVTGNPDLDQAFQYPFIFASAPGYGPGWIRGDLKTDPSANLAVKLAEEGPPIEGRIIDLEGRPVADAQIKAEGIMYEGKGDFAAWIARARADELGNVYDGLEHLSIEPLLPTHARSGPDGRFFLRGIGKDRVVELMISGPGIITTRSYVMTRDEPKIQLSGPVQVWPETRLIHPPRFELALPPGRRVEGVARDQDTGRPIADLEIHAGVFDDIHREQVLGAESKTDAEGRYRLDGLPRSETYRLFVQRSPGLPYTGGSFKVTAESPDLEPVAFDFILKRGIVVRGKVTDKVTGEPIRAEVGFYPLAGNPRLGEYPGFSDSYFWDHGRNGSTGSNGEYEVVAISGPGQLAVRTGDNRYGASGRTRVIARVVSDDKAEPEAPKLSFTPNPTNGANLVKETNFEPGLDTTTVNFELDPGRSVTVEVVDPDGHPLDGLTVKKARERGWSTGPEPARFEVRALDPSEPCRLTIFHEARKLIAFVILKGDEPSPFKIKLQSWGSITGRIVDDGGQPRPGLLIMDDNRPDLRGMMPSRQEGRGPLLGDEHLGLGMPIGDDARFRIERLIPGFKYQALAADEVKTGKSSRSSTYLGHLFEDVTVAPGEVKDLGDLKIRPLKPLNE